MFKVVSAEIKKIVSKPGIYILSVLLALILVLGVFIYKPKVYENTQFELNGVTYIEKYTEFMGDINKGKKAESQTKLNNAIKSVNNYRISYSGEIYTQKEYVAELMNKFEEVYNAYRDCSTDGSFQTYIDTVRGQLITSLENINSAVDNALINSQYGSYSLITTTKNYEDYKSVYKQVLNWANVSVEKINLREHFIEFEDKYSEQFHSTINNFKYPTLSDGFINTYTNSVRGTKLFTLNNRLDEIMSLIEENYELAIADSALNIKSAPLMDEYANLYVNTVDTYVNLVKYELISNAFSTSSISEKTKLLHLSEYSNYNSNSLLQRYSYLFKNNKSENDFSKPLTIGVAANGETTGYDYAYFVLKIFSFVIIVYAIMSACHSIAGEIREGSIRYLSIRPISRTNLFFGKWFAILIMSLILIAFSFIISLCVGNAVYGLTSNPILTIFNGSKAFTIHPLAMIGIYLGSMVLELMIYSMLAMLFSVIFKSDLMSMTVLLVLYLLNTLLPIFIQGTNTWLAYYPFSHISLYSLFGSSVYAIPNNFFNIVFGAKVYAGTNIALTTSVILLLIAISCGLAITLFKKKEL